MTSTNAFHKGWNHTHAPFSATQLAEIGLNGEEIEYTARAYEQLAQLASPTCAELESIISYIDLTTLDGADTADRVEALCDRALAPLGDASAIRTAAVCVYPHWLATAKQALNGALPVAVVAGGFPHGQSPLSSRIHEVAECAKAGADEIDIVITRAHVLQQDWNSLYHDIAAMKQAAGDVPLKTILSVGDIQNYTLIARAAYVAMLAGSDFIKTSTGKEPVNATLPYSLAMLRMIKHFHGQTGIRIGFKPAGGIATTQTARSYLLMMQAELGSEWLHPHYFRIGASSLLGNVAQDYEILPR